MNSSAERPAGFLLVDKSPGWTSHDVVARLRKLLGEKKTGHAGTLDPMATGLLVVAVGRSTRLIRFVQDASKEYVATAQLGVSTDTLDAEGSVLERSELPVSEAEVEAVLPRFTGHIMQVPPMVSALKMGGRRLYDLARAGEEIERAPRPVEVQHIEVVDFAPSSYPVMTLRVTCGKGTYIRTLADDIARALGGRAHLTALRRTRIGSLLVDDAVSMEVLDAEAADGDVRSRLMTPAAGLRDLPAVAVPDDVVAGVSHGTPFARPALGPGVPEEGPFCVLDAGGSLLAVYRAAGNRLMPDVVTV